MKTSTLPRVSAALFLCLAIGCAVQVRLLEGPRSGEEGLWMFMSAVCLTVALFLFGSNSIATSSRPTRERALRVLALGMCLFIALMFGMGSFYFTKHGMSMDMGTFAVSGVSFLLAILLVGAFPSD